MCKVKAGIGLLGVVLVGLASVGSASAQSDELPRELRERISRTLVEDGFPSAAAAFDTEVKITASDGAGGDFFGFPVAISGDTAIVGASRDDDNGFQSGSAYVYQRDEGGVDNWGQVTKITASDGAAFDEFGFSVAISGDTAIVGALLDDDNATNSGSAYVYFGVVCNDNDGDGYGSPGDASCPNGAAEDCDDNDANIFPGATEVCTGAADDDCDGFVDCDDVDCACDPSCDVMPPTITCPESVTEVPTSPEGAEVEYETATAEDDCDPTPTVGCEPVSGSLFAIGTTTTVDCTATDASDNEAVCSFEVTVLAAEEVPEEIIDDVQDLIDSGAINEGQGTALKSKLEQIIAKIGQGQINAACNLLNAFINQVNALINGGTLAPEEGQPLIDAAENLRVVIEC